MDVFFLFYSSLFNCLLLHSSCEGCRVFPAQLLHSHTHRHAHDDGPVRLACCTHEEGRDERRAEGAVTRGRATRACGAEHTFLPSCFVFVAARAGRHPQRHTHSHTLPPCFSLRICFALRVYFMRWRTLRCRPREHFSPLR
ncbi:hypothetical protein Tc00.1047053507071.340 [Trypanosoma cruzi]|uniref:ATPase n=1 Tax=Trypanosoma cruzi (strain CL Brener) TaxID=353153 RepID=Q4E3D3_TRYCC|nr:hypothetical protein Tc00.1047053507071.340 [Trypanosoma cruzi]EAN99301.1 hypothetical protein Tc00.1047053507071.340 [Trypanosoma cruzi]|eukprot:XP_821152.1 hypothetical protein [Trypanosoma cruzi strain CL Brener]